MTILEEVLEHHGVKGMHWGTRNGEKVGPSADATKAHAKKDIGKHSGVRALSNEEIRLVVDRLNLEKQFKTLAPTPSQAAAKFIGDLLKQNGKQHASKALGDATVTAIKNAKPKTS
jgi:hypothetical protein